MSRGGYARVVVADGLLALAGELGVVEVQPGLREGGAANGWLSCFLPAQRIRAQVTPGDS